MLNFYVTIKTAYSGIVKKKNEIEHLKLKELFLRQFMLLFYPLTLTCITTDCKSESCICIRNKF